MSKAGASLATCYGPVSADVIAKAENIRLLILDVDGVLSDGLIYMGNNGEELKRSMFVTVMAFVVRSPLILKSLSLPGERLNW